jgi:hypothetical protein
MLWALVRNARYDRWCASRGLEPYELGREPGMLSMGHVRAFLKDVGTYALYGGPDSDFEGGDDVARLREGVCDMFRTFVRIDAGFCVRLVSREAYHAFTPVC